MTLFKTASGKIRNLPPLIKQPIPIELDATSYEGAVVLGTDNEIYVSDGAAWVNVNGLSAYELAVENGFEGTVEEWLYSLAEEANQIALEFANQAANSANSAEYWAAYSLQQAINSANSAILSQYWYTQTAEVADDAYTYVNSANSTLQEINETIDDTRIALFSLTIGYVNTQTRAIKDSIYFENQISQLTENDVALTAGQIDANQRYITVLTRLDDLETAQLDTESAFTSISTTLDNLTSELDSLI